MLGASVVRTLRFPVPHTLLFPVSCRTSAVVCSPALSSLQLLAPWKCCVRRLQLCSALFAGHNKWSKVRHIKGPKDEARAKMFLKFNMMIRIAVKEGGPNPDFNANLAQIMEVCRSKNMPKASVDNAIKSAEKAKAASQMVYEARGPGGCLLLIEILTDNLNRTRHEMKFLLSKNGAALSEGVRHGFTRKGVVTSLAKTLSLERALELAIEAGAEDVQETEDEEEQPLLKFICDIVELKNVRTALESEGMSIVSSGVECIPRNMSSLNEEQLNVAASLLEALQNCPDVVRVWDNIQASS